jgi:hypothetical protein
MARAYKMSLGKSNCSADLFCRAAALGRVRWEEPELATLNSSLELRGFVIEGKAHGHKSHDRSYQLPATWIGRRRSSLGSQRARLPAWEACSPTGISRSGENHL